MRLIRRKRSGPLIISKNANDLKFKELKPIGA